MALFNCLSRLFALLILLCLLVSSQTKTNSNSPLNNTTEERLAVLKVLNDETKYAFERDYKRWSDCWVQNQHISKTYINLAEGSASESLGWNEISGFVKDFMDQNPEPEPVPEPITKANVKVYGNAAWVTYNQLDSIRGRKRETRLMEKSENRWKIAGMHTTIYGFEE